MFGAIPMPKGFSESFLEGSDKSSQMLERLMSAKRLEQAAAVDKLRTDPAAFVNALKQFNGSPTTSAAGSNGATMGDFSNSPIVRGWAKQTLGYDPWAPTPEQAKKDFYSWQKQQERDEALTRPTTAFITQNRSAIQAIDNLIPEIEGLLKKSKNGEVVGELREDIPNQAWEKWLHPDAQAAYESDTGATIDQLLTAQKLAKNEHSTKLVESMVRMHPLESKSGYAKRLLKLIDTLKNNKGTYTEELQAGTNKVKGHPAVSEKITIDWSKYPVVGEQ